MPHLIIPKSKMPTIDVPLINGGTFSLADTTAENFQLVVIYRGIHCPKCKAQLQEIDTKMNDILADGMDIVAISMDNEDRAKRAAQEWDIKKLPIGYDLSLRTAKELGLFLSDSISDSEPDYFSEPGLFVVRPDGSLYAQYIQNTPFGRPNLSELLAGMKYATKNDYPARGTSVA